MDLLVKIIQPKILFHAILVRTFPDESAEALFASSSYIRPLVIHNIKSYVFHRQQVANHFL